MASKGPGLWLSIFRVSFCRGLVFARRSPNIPLFGVRNSRRISLSFTLPNSLDFENLAVGVSVSAGARYLVFGVFTAVSSSFRYPLASSVRSSRSGHYLPSVHETFCVV